MIAQSSDIVAQVVEVSTSGSRQYSADSHPGSKRVVVVDVGGGRPRIRITRTASSEPLFLRERVLHWLSMNPGKYPRQVAQEFGISGLRASQITGELLRDGLLDFAE